MKTFGISGWIIDRKTAHGLSGLRVEAWDRAGLCPDLVDCAMTEEDGRFELSVSEPHIKELFGDRLPELTFRVFSGQTLVSSAPSGAVWRLGAPATAIRIRVDPDAPAPGAEGPAPFVARGRVARALTGPTTKVRVRAFDRRLAVSGSREILLGEATTDARGLYQITYTVAAGAPKLKPDLILRAYDSTDAVLAESPVLCRAPTATRLDLIIGGEVWAGPSEHERLTSRLAPHLTEAELDLTELDDQAIAHLACSAGVDRKKMVWLHAAARLARTTDLRPELFFALASQGLPLDLPALLPHGPEALTGALDRAVASHAVPATLADALREDLPRLLSAIVDAALAQPAEPGRSSLGAVLATGLQPIEEQRALLSLYQSRTGEGAAFWKQAYDQFQSPGILDDLKLSLQLGMLTQGNLPLLEQLRDLRNEGRLGTLADLTGLAEADWRAFLTKAGGASTIPPHVAGVTPEERVARYLTGIMDPLRIVFPGQCLRRELQKASGAGGPIHVGVAKVLANAPQLDVRADRIDQKLGEIGEGAFAGIPEGDRPLVVRQLKAIQRLSRVTPRAEAVVALMGAGFDSAQSIARAPLARFVRQLAGALGGEAEAKLAYAQARHHAAGAQMAHIALRQAIRDPAPWALTGGPLVQPGSGGDAPSSPDLATLFGALELCDCDHCQSIYSPAAYFVDLLQFLDFDPGGALRPVEALFARRPDLQHILLTCANTNTPIPYIDLVNEVLEAYVKVRFVDGGDPAADLPARDTGEATAAELRAVPQYVLDEAYSRLAGEVFPPELPFDRPSLVARTYLEHLGTTRLRVMETFRRDEQPSGAELVAEALGLSGVGYRVLAGLPLEPPRLLREFYGYDSDSVTFHDPVSDQEVVESWKDNLARVPELLRRTGITYAELLELVKSWFVNRAQSDPAQRMELESDTAECDLGRTRLTHLTDAALHRMHRMLRLRRSLGGTLADLDRALFALGATEIDEAALHKLADAKRLSAELGRPLPELLPLWSDIDTWGNDALYLRLFQNRADASREDLAAFALAYPFANPDIKSGTILPEIAPPGVQLGQRDAVLLAALRMSSSDLARLCTRLGLENGAPLSIATLSALYRHAFLARALGLRVPELLALLDLTTPEAGSARQNPFQLHEPAGAVAFAEKVRKVQRSGFKVADLDYLLRHRADPGRSLAPTPAKIDDVLAKIQAELGKVAADTAIPDDPTGEELDRRLALVFDGEIVRQAMGVVLDQPEHRPADPEAFLAEHFAPFAHPKEAAAYLIKENPLSEDQKRANVIWVHERLAPWLRDTLSRRLVIEALADAVKLDVSLTGTLLSSLLRARVETGKPAMADFLALAESAPAAGHTMTFELLHKAALLVRGFGLGEREVVHLSTHAERFDGFSLDALPLAAVEGAAGTWFARWERLADLARLRGSVGKGTNWPFDLFERQVPPGQDPLQDLTAFVADLTGWDSGLLASLTGPSGLDFEKADFRTEQRLLELSACISLTARLGVSPETLFAWASAPPTADQARAVVQAVRARAGSSGGARDEQWLEVARALNDRLREAQRSALVAFLVPRLAEEGITGAEQLFEHFLIDTQMSACGATSRIKQAISSVQTFVQRCLLGLERPAVQPESIDAGQWTWRKNYRVWEANRKVFLYPENWIEPELRDDKSPFFKELETELLQKDLSEPAVEQALTHYLEKLDDVARLEVCGMYWQQEPAEAAGAQDIDVLHVFGRTWNEPRIYYYRRLVNRREWTPWERVSLDIQSNHLIPVVHDRRLYLFWAIFTPKPVEVEVPADDQLPLVRWEIKLAWSEHRQGKWTPKQLAKVSDASEADFGAPPPAEDITFLVRRLGSSLRVLQGHLVPTISRDLNAWNPNSFYQRSRSVLEACSGELLVEPQRERVWHGLYVPQHARSSSMDLAFGGTSELVIERAALVQRKVLGSIGVRSRMLISRDMGDLSSGQLRPFFWQDAFRTYFALPVDIRLVLTLDLWPTFEAPDFEIFLGDIMSKVPLPDLGDPAPGLPGAGAVSGDLGVGAPQHTLMSGLGGFGDVTYNPSAAQTMGEVLSGNAMIDLTTATVQRLRFSAFEHPYVCPFIKALRRDGVKGLLTLGNQELTRDGSTFGGSYFNWEYEPTSMVHAPYPTHDVDFTPEGAYSLYNWELFFHAPWLIADRLSQEQRHEEAQRWYHFIFDPTTDSPDEAPQRFWNVLPLRGSTALERAQDLLALLSYAGSDPDLLARKRRVEDQVAQWEQHPFQPHRIARLRPAAYQKAVAMKYIDNLLAWGDQLFQRDTIESINEATQLYLLATSILGPRPERVPAKGRAADETYATLKEKGLDAFSNAVVELENLVFPSAITAPAGAGENGLDAILAAGATLYFCTPPNSELLAYWDLVEDRLFKLRHCMNIEGVVRELPLFEPPIDPALLVRAAAAGGDLGAAIADLYAPLPFYRFGLLHAKAMEMVGELRSLAASLLAALEKKDAEALANLRAGQETGLLKAVHRVRARQVEEAEAALAGLEKARKVTEERHRFYRDIKDRSSFEAEQIDRLREAQDFQELANLTEFGVALAAQIPNVTTGTSGLSPVVTATFGGLNVVAALQANSRLLAWKGGNESYKANMASIKGSWARRSEEWKFQERLAVRELAQIDQQIAAARLRVQIAGLELENHERQLENAVTVEEFLRDKYTNEELYGWMVSQTSALYFQVYKLAYDLAKRAERAYRYERGLTSSDFIRSGSWEDLRRGLLAGERLALDLKRLEGAYLEQNRREYELTKQVSLADHDPFALLQLRETGRCELSLPEWCFDLDHPGHFFRRLKTVSATAAGVTAPYAGINGRLTLKKSTIRSKSTLLSTEYRRDPDQPDNRFMDDYVAQSIVTSSGQADSGLFEVNLRDERLLPFEGAGAESVWELDFPAEHNQLDAEGLSNVVLHLRYTAREGGDLLKASAEADLRRPREPAERGPLERFRLLSVKHDFPALWRAFRKAVPADVNERVLTLPITRRLFPRILGRRDVKVIRVDLFTKWVERLRPETPGDGPRLYLTVSDTEATLDLKGVGSYLTTDGVDTDSAVLDADEENFVAWTLVAKRNSAEGEDDEDDEEIPTNLPPGAFDDRLLRGDALEDLWFVLTYTQVPTSPGGTS